MKSIAVATLLLVLMFTQENLKAQDMRSVSDSIKLYVKSCESGRGDIELCTLCQDKALTKRCALYFFSKKLKHGAPVILSLAQARDLLADKDPGKITGFRTMKRTDRNYYLVQQGTASTYILPTKTGYVIQTYDNEVGSSGFPQAMPRIRSPEEMNEMNACLDRADNAYDDCINKCANAGGSQGTRATCANACSDARSTSNTKCTDGPNAERTAITVKVRELIGAPGGMHTQTK